MSKSWRKSRRRRLGKEFASVQGLGWPFAVTFFVCKGEAAEMREAVPQSVTVAVDGARSRSLRARSNRRSRRTALGEFRGRTHRIERTLYAPRQHASTACAAAGSFDQHASHLRQNVIWIASTK